MFTPPSVNQIAKAYQGNPAPLGQKVEADKQRNGGIPSDLRQLLALNDITQGRNAMGIQQALQIPTNMPTVAEDLQERARQALQARMMQQAQEEQSRSGQPNVIPMGTPRPPMQAQGLDSLESNVGEGYAEGGIVGFDDGGGVSDQQIKDWFATNQGASDTDIYNAMKQHNVGTDQLTKAMGFNPTEVDQRYGVQARADIFKPERSREEQESMVNQFYQDKGLTEDQLGQTNFGYPVDTRESRSESRPFTTLYRDYQKDLANTGRYDAPAGTQFRAKAVYAPDSIGDRGSIKLIDSVTGLELTNLGGANSIGNTRNAFDLLDKFAVDPASYRQAASQMYESMGKPGYMQDDYKYLTGYKPRDTAAATDTYLTKPLASATSADLKPKYEKDANNRQTADSKINVFYEIPMTNLLKSKGLSGNEASNLLGQLRPVAGLVNFAEISRSKDPVKALVGTLNYLQSKGLTNRGFASGGIASLDSNTLVGNAQHFQEGGAVGRTQHFQSKGLVSGSLSDASDSSETFDILADRPREVARKKAEQEAEEKMRFLEVAAPEVAERIKRELTKTSGTPVLSPAQQPETASIRSQLNAADAASRSQPGTPPPPRERPAAQTRVNTDSAPMPAGLQGLVSSLATPGLDYQRKMLNQDENALAAAKIALYDKEVGARDLSIYDRTAAELEARKQKLNAPKAGYDAMMEYLEQIAIGGGRTSAESGSLGASRQRALQKDRLSQQDVLMDKILELGAKKSDAMFTEKKGRFDLTQAEKDRVIKEKLEAAQKLGLSEDKTRELIEQGLQRELDRKNELKKAGMNASAASRDNLMSRAQALMAADKTLTLDQAMQRAGEIANAGTMEGAAVRNRKAYDDAVEKISTNYRYVGMLADKKNKPENAALRTEYADKIKELQARYGVVGQGLNALPGAASSGKVPPPPGYNRD